MNNAKKFPTIILLLAITACAAPTVTPDTTLQGEWQFRTVSKTKVGKNGLACTDVGGTIDIRGTRFRGVTRNENNFVYYIIGTQVADGSVKGQIRVRAGSPSGTFEGKINGGLLQGTFVGPQGCRGIWTASRVP